MHCDLIFILDDGTELIGKEKINKHIDKFPVGILEKLKPIFFGEIAKESRYNGWGKSVIKVYQSGKYDLSSDNEPEPPFGLN